MSLVWKAVITALLVVAVSEMAKRSTALAGLLASLPLVSVLSFCWIYLDTKNPALVAELSGEVLWFVLPSLLFFVALPFLIRSGVGFWASLGCAALVTSMGYLFVLLILREGK